MSRRTDAPHCQQWLAVVRERRRLARLEHELLSAIARRRQELDSELAPVIALCGGTPAEALDELAEMDYDRLGDDVRARMLALDAKLAALPPPQTLQTESARHVYRVRMADEEHERQEEEYVRWQCLTPQQQAAEERVRRHLIGSSVGL